MKRKSSQKLEWLQALDIEVRLDTLIRKAKVDWVKRDQIYAYRSKHANTRAYARIWGLARIWQTALSIPPSYVIEVVSEKFDKLGEADKDKVLLHEIAHIPKNFSGSLLAHTHRGEGSFHGRLNKLIATYKKNI